MQAFPAPSSRETSGFAPADYLRPDSTGPSTAATSQLPGKSPSADVFYLLTDTPEPSDITGSKNLRARYDLEDFYHKILGKKIKEKLSSFLPRLPGNIDTPGCQDNSCLRSLIEVEPTLGRKLLPLSAGKLSGFRLHRIPGKPPRSTKPY